MKNFTLYREAGLHWAIRIWSDEELTQLVDDELRRSGETLENWNDEQITPCETLVEAAKEYARQFWQAEQWPATRKGLRQMIKDLKPKTYYHVVRECLERENFKLPRDHAIHFMNPHTGSVGTRDNWWYETEQGEQVNAVDRGEVVPVEKNATGEWVEMD